MTPTSTSSSKRTEFQGAASSRALAHVLAGCWRRDVVPVKLEAAQLDALLPSLIGSGTGALAWRRLRHSTLANQTAVLTLQQLHLKQALDTRLQERQIRRVFELLQGEGIPALLIKGWATGRLYPEAGLRARGDIDLLVDPAAKTATERLLGIRVDDDSNAVWDIKTQVPALYKVSAPALFARQERVKLGEIEVATLGAEDHLRVLCLHFLKHGGWRPLWLCDIAAALEFRPAEFDWEICLGSDPRCADAVACTLGLAHQLLGASIAQTPVTRRAAQLPSWLAPAVLNAWKTPQSKQHRPHPLLMESLRERKGVMQAALKRWPNPIQAAMERQTPLNWPPLPAQTASFVATSFYFLKRGGRSPRE